MIKALCFDLGDTLIAEETVVHNSSGQAVTAHAIKGVFKVSESIKKGGHEAGIIANGDSSGTRNIIASCGLAGYFDSIMVSQETGIDKPDKRIFQAALDKLGAKAQEAVMVGNRIDEDIVGANRIGLKSMWFKWNNRYQETIDTEEKRPDFIINSLLELPGILALM